MAIISKAEFEKLAPGSPKTVGTVIELTRYVSSNKALETLSDGGALFLVTVRPPDERLMLVAILEEPKHKDSAWVGRGANATIAADITALRDHLKFDSGKGIAAKPGALGMSLQTPRKLTEADVMLLRNAAAGSLPKGAKPAPEDEAPKGKPPAKKSKQKPKVVAEEVLQIMESAFVEIEGEYLDEIRENPDKVLEEATFSMTIQSIYSGSFEEAKDALPVLRALAPFADGRIVAGAIAKEVESGADALSMIGEIVDAFCISAINLFGTAIVALALDRPKDVPAVAGPYREHLMPHAEKLRELLAEE